MPSWFFWKWTPSAQVSFTMYYKSAAGAGASCNPVVFVKYNWVATGWWCDEWVRDQEMMLEEKGGVSPEGRRGRRGFM